MNYRKRKGSTLAIAILVFALFVVFSAALTLTAKSYYDNATRRYQREQAYLTAKSVVESLTSDTSALASFMNASLTKLGTQQTVYLGQGGTTEADKQMGTAYAVVTYDKDAKQYGLAVTATYDGVSATVMAILKHSAATVTTPPAIFATLAGNVGTIYLTDTVVGTSSEHSDVYIRSSNRSASQNWGSDDYIGHLQVANGTWWGSTQMLYGNLIVEFVRPDTGYLSSDVLEVRNLNIDGNLYVIPNTADDSAGNGDGDGVLVLITDCTISGKVVVIGSAGSMTVTSSTIAGDTIDYKNMYSDNDYLTLNAPTATTKTYNTTAVTIPTATPSAVSASKTGSYYYCSLNSGSAVGAIKLSDIGSKKGVFSTNLVFNVPAGQTHTYVIDCSGISDIERNWLVEGGGKVVIYLTNADNLAFYNMTGGSNSIIGGLLANRTVTAPDVDVMDIYTNDYVYFFCEKNGGAIYANLYGRSITLSLEDMPGYNDSYIFQGGFVGRRLYVNGAHEQNYALFKSFEPAFTPSDSGSGSGTTTDGWAVDHYE